MEKAPALLALDRIEAALARIETVAAAALQSPADGSAPHPPSPGALPADGDLPRRHEDLRRTVARSLAELDALLAERG